ncbi:MAG: hypothetical protein ABSF34_01430 [Verrucomicrobiota bacterium]|jgi:hypothetical protein
MSRQNGIEAQFTRFAYHFARQYSVSLLSKSGLTIMFFEGFILPAKDLPKAQSNVLQIAVYFLFSIAICIDGLI